MPQPTLNSSFDLLACYRKIRFQIYKRLRRWTMPFGRLLNYIPDMEGNVYDLGCGYGLFLTELAETLRGRKSRFYGFDSDKSKIDFAVSLNKQHNIRFEEKDISKDFDLERPSCIILCDVLYYKPWPEQDRLFKKCYEALLPGGVLIVKDIGSTPRWKFIWHWAQERVMYSVVRRKRGVRFYFRSAEAYSNFFGTLGAKVDTIPLHKGYPYPHVLFVCSKEKKLADDRAPA